MHIFILRSWTLGTASSTLCPWTFGCFQRDVGTIGFSIDGLSIWDLSISAHLLPRSRCKRGFWVCWLTSYALSRRKTLETKIYIMTCWSSRPKSDMQAHMVSHFECFASYFWVHSHTDWNPPPVRTEQSAFVESGVIQASCNWCLWYFSYKKLEQF